MRSQTPVPRKRKSVDDVDWNSVTGLPPEMPLRLLRRCDYSDAEIAGMNQDQKAAALREAIEFRLYAGSLPPSPIEVTQAEGPKFFDVETGDPLTLEEVARRGVCVYRSPDTIPAYPRFEKSSLKRTLLKYQQDHTLDLADREHLKRLAADERLEEHWNHIVRCCKPGRIGWPAHLACASRTTRSRICRALSRKTAARAERRKSCQFLEEERGN